MLLLSLLHMHINCAFLFNLNYLFFRLVLILWLLLYFSCIHYHPSPSFLSHTLPLQHNYISHSTSFYWLSLPPSLFLLFCFNIFACFCPSLHVSWLNFATIWLLLFFNFCYYFLLITVVHFYSLLHLLFHLLSILFLLLFVVVYTFGFVWLLWFL